MIKNSSTTRYKACCSMKADHKILLTGTPLHVIRKFLEFYDITKNFFSVE
jgi:SNF2 family DNA or RNA helicase